MSIAKGEYPSVDAAINKLIINQQDSPLEYNGSWGWSGFYKKSSGGPSIAGMVLWSFYNNDIPYEGDYKNSVDRAANYLSRSQNQDGGWGGSLADSQPSSVGVTNYALMGWISRKYIAGKDPTGNQNIVEGMNYLVNNMKDSHWLDTWNTAIATMNLQVGHTDPNHIDARMAGIQWLKDNQNINGSWGTAPGEIGTVNDTTMTLIALHADSSDDPNTFQNDPNIIKAATWLVGTQNPDGGWANIPDVPVANAHSTALAIWALSLIEPQVNPPLVEIFTDKDKYYPGETVEITVKLSEPVCVITGSVTWTDGTDDPLFFTQQDPNTYTASCVVPLIPPGVCSIDVDVLTCDSRTGSGIEFFVVLEYPGPKLVMREPKVEDDGVHINREGVNDLRILWSESVVFEDADVSIFDANDLAVPFSTDESNSNPQIMRINFDKTLEYDRYTITIHDTVVSVATGRPIDGDDDGVAGGDAVIVMEHRERHDSDNDNDLDLIDFANFASKWLWIKKE